jgi:tRNA U54 and U55 pseudouridine synthase Pus10
VQCIYIRDREREQTHPALELAYTYVRVAVLVCTCVLSHGKWREDLFDKAIGREDVDVRVYVTGRRQLMAPIN